MVVTIGKLVVDLGGGGEGGLDSVAESSKRAVGLFLW